MHCLLWEEKGGTETSPSWMFDVLGLCLFRQLGSLKASMQFWHVHSKFSSKTMMHKLLKIHSSTHKRKPERREEEGVTSCIFNMASY